MKLLACILLGLTACGGSSCKNEHCSTEFGLDVTTGQYKPVYVCICLDGSNP